MPYASAIWSSRQNFDSWKAANPDVPTVVSISDPAYEFCDDDGNGSGRVWACAEFPASDLDELVASGVEVRMGNPPDGPTWPLQQE